MGKSGIAISCCLQGSPESEAIPVEIALTGGCGCGSEQTAHNPDKFPHNFVANTRDVRSPPVTTFRPKCVPPLGQSGEEATPGASRTLFVYLFAAQPLPRLLKLKTITEARKGACRGANFRLGGNNYFPAANWERPNTRPEIQKLSWLEESRPRCGNVANVGCRGLPILARSLGDKIYLRADSCGHIKNVYVDPNHRHLVLEES